jgi:hypothetical protein
MWHVAETCRKTIQAGATLEEYLLFFLKLHGANLESARALVLAAWHRRAEDDVIPSQRRTARRRGARDG